MYLTMMVIIYGTRVIISPIEPTFAGMLIEETVCREIETSVASRIRSIRESLDNNLLDPNPHLSTQVDELNGDMRVMGSYCRKEIKKISPCSDG
jgi:hypothetical protein